MYYFLMLHDIAEIVFYSSILYCFCLWLKTDTSKNILIYFLAYCALIIGAWVLELSTLTPFLLSYSPIALLLFIIFHQKTLQRNFITLCTISSSDILHKDWLTILLSNCLTSINNKKNASIIIEHKNSLEQFLDVPFFINAQISKELITIFLSSDLYDEEKMVWLDTTGRIRSINTLWHSTPETAHLSLIKNALFYTLHTDAIMIHTNHINRTFSIIINGKETTALSAQQIHTLIKKQLSMKTTHQNKGSHHESITTEKSLF